MRERSCHVVRQPQLSLAHTTHGAGVKHKTIRRWYGGRNKKLEALEVAQRKHVWRPWRWHGVSISELLLRKWRGELLEEESLSVRNSTELRVWFEWRVFK